jgi:hypothetical protein
MTASQTPTAEQAEQATTPDHLTIRDSDGFPVDVIMLPGDGFYEMFEPF